MKPDVIAKRKTTSSPSPSPYEEATSKRPKQSAPPSRNDDNSSRGSRKKEMLAVEKVTAHHILVKHSGSRRKASWRDPEGLEIKKTPRYIALEKLMNARKEIVDGKKKFEDVARNISDCSSGKRGGSLGSFGRGKMQKPFEEVAFALKVGEISEIVDTDSGIHIILRTA